MEKPIIPMQKQVVGEMVSVMFQALQEAVDEHKRKGYVLPYAPDGIIRIKTHQAT